MAGFRGHERPADDGSTATVNSGRDRPAARKSGPHHDTEDRLTTRCSGLECRQSVQSRPKDDDRSGGNVADVLLLAAGSLLDCDPISLLRCAAGAGFDGVGLRLSHDRSASAHELLEIRRCADDLGLCIHDVEVHRIGEGVDSAALLEACSVVGASKLLTVSDLASTSETTTHLHVLCAAAASVGVRVGLEYMAWTNPNNPVDALSMATETGCTIVVDVLHHSRVGAGPPELQGIVDANALGWLQLCDAPTARPPGGQAELLHEARHERVAPGDGGLALTNLLRILPPGVTISVEVQSDALLRHFAPDKRAKKLAEAARRVLDQAVS